MFSLTKIAYKGLKYTMPYEAMQNTNSGEQIMEDLHQTKSQLESFELKCAWGILQSRAQWAQRRGERTFRTFWN